MSTTERLAAERVVLTGSASVQAAQSHEVRWQTVAVDSMDASITQDLDALWQRGQQLLTELGITADVVRIVELRALGVPWKLMPDHLGRSAAGARNRLRRVCARLRVAPDELLFLLVWFHALPAPPRLGNVIRSLGVSRPIMAGSLGAGGRVMVAL